MSDKTVLIEGGLRKTKKQHGVYNSAFMVSGKGWVNYYDKHILLPFAETSPFGKNLGAFYHAPSEFLKGQTSATFTTQNGKIGVSICFEILYADFIRYSVKNGAEILVNISNDGWFGKSAMPILHLDAARMRSIENRMFLLRASNNGISAIISPTGKLLKSSRLFKKEQLLGHFKILNHASLFTRLGHWVVIGAGLILLSAFGRVLLK